MPKILTNLRIDEVSTVDKGAGEGVKIVLMKRASLPEKCGKSFDEIMGAEAVAKASRALFEHLHDRLERRREQHGYQKSERKQLMDIERELVSLMKNYGGPIALCKSVVDQGRAPCSEAELVSAISKFADASGGNGDVAFARLYESDAMVWKACQIAKENEFAAAALDMTPQVISGGEWRDEEDRVQAMKQLAEIGRRMAPSATPEKQFAVAFEDPKNAALAQRAHKRPSPTTYFAFPR